MTGSEAQPVIVVLHGPQPQPVPWIGIGIGAMLFLWVAWRARQRAGEPRAGEPSRPGRIAEAALIWAGAYYAMRAPGFMALDRGMDQSSPLGILFGLLGFMIVAALLIGTADLLLDGLRPRRNRLWLIGGPPVVALFGLGFLAATGWMDMIGRWPGWHEVMLAAAALIAGLAWWSRLPAADRVAGIFD